METGPFVDPALNQSFLEKGYVVRPLLSPAEIKQINDLFFSLEESKNEGFFTSMNLEKIPDRHRVDAGIKAVVADKARALLPGYRPLLGNFTIKKPGQDSELRIHLDWSVVDERRFRSIGIWIPLIDVDEKTGGLGVLEGSHRVGHSYRGSMVNFLAFESSVVEGDFLQLLKDRYPAKLLCLAAGHAVIYDLSLGHFSPPNMGKKIRLATNLMMIPEVAQPVHYFREGEQIRTLEVDTDFFLNRNMVEPPNLDQYANFLEEESASRIFEEQFGTDIKIGPGEYEVERFAGEKKGFWEKIRAVFRS